MTGRTRDYRGKQYAEDRGTVHLHSLTGRYPAAVVDLVNEQTKVEEHTASPERADYLVTTSAIDRRITLTANRFKATPISMPAAAEYLRAKFAEATEAGRNVRVVIYSPSQLY